MIITIIIIIITIIITTNCHFFVQNRLFFVVEFYSNSPPHVPTCTLDRSEVISNPVTPRVIRGSLYIYCTCACVCLCVGVWVEGGKGGREEGRTGGRGKGIKE